MWTKVRKEDDRYVMFNLEKIAESISKASMSVNKNGLNMDELIDSVLVILPNEMKHKIPSTDDVGRAVEKALMHAGYDDIARAFILYRDNRHDMREANSSLMQAVQKITIEAAKDNANTPPSFPSKVLQVSEAALAKYTLSRVLSKEVSEAHRSGAIHIHDLFGYGLAPNCISVPLKKMLIEGFSTGTGNIRPPKRPSSILALAAIILQSNQNEMVGGQMYAHFDSDIAEIIKTNCKHEPTEDEIYQAVEGFIYNLNTMASRFGAQRIFSTIVIGSDTSKLGRMVTKYIFKVMQEGMDGSTFIWPNVVYRLKDGLNLKKGDPNYDLTLLAYETASFRMNPTFLFMDASYNREYGNEVTYMGCRTRAIANINGPEVVDGRGNVSFTTINLPRIAYEAKFNKDKALTILEKRLKLVEEQLLHRLELTGNLRKEDFPFLFGQNIYIGSDKLKPEDKIFESLKQGTQTFGFVGLEEFVKLITGKFMYESEESRSFGISIIKKMRDYSDECTDRHHLNFSVLGTPAESASGRFCRLDKQLYGEIVGINDKGFYTNSSHISVDANITVFEKMNFEAPFHGLCNGGHICHVFLDSAPINNIKAIEDIILYAQQIDIGYLAINFPINECKVCGNQDPIIENKCPKCGSKDIRKLRRITGYLAPVDSWGTGKLDELKKRVDR
jgi:ribonucleoside-triphosphate reductase